jgi:hypothetical protein
VIRAITTPGGIIVEPELPRGAVAYIDADWIPAGGSDELPALVVTDRSIAWYGSDSVERPREVEPDGAAALVLLRLAQYAADVVRGVAAATVDVVGDGAVARSVASLLGLPSATKPAAIVDASGEPGLIAAATKHVSDLGLIVLAGEPAGRALTLDLYPDVHVRGLQVAGVSRPDLAHLSWAGEAFLPEVLVNGPTAAQPAQPLPAGAWYRVTP